MVLLIVPFESDQLSVGDAIKLNKLLDRNFDYALPQDWVDAVKEKLYNENPVGNFVWYYPDGDIVGYPMPLTTKGLEILGKLAQWATLWREE